MDNSHTGAQELVESRDYVTPYAFKVPEELYGIALAKPWKRGLAILVDLALVGMLTYVSSVFMAAAASLVLVRSSSRLRGKGRFPILRKLLVGVAALLLFVVVLASMEIYRDATEGKYGSGSFVEDARRATDIGVFSAHMLQMSMTSDNILAGECAPALECWQTIGTKLMSDFDRFVLPEDQQREVIDELYKEAEQTLSPAELESLKLSIEGRFAEIQQAQQHTTMKAEPDVKLKQVKDLESKVDALSETEKAPPSMLDWFKGVLADLGIGFGWAALYFTVFTAWWKGQTPGKKIFGLKVICLDGHSPNLWESFERYGGYGAGLATGLLGFLQIFWDNNRQAIQDKISETLVLDLRKPSVGVEKIAT